MIQGNARERLGYPTQKPETLLERIIGERITLVDFGTFHVMERKARKGRNPQTGEKLEISAKKVPEFRAGKNLREAVR